MKNSFALVFLGFSVLMVGTILVASSYSYQNSLENDLQQAFTQQLSSSNLTTVRGWNTCVDEKVPIACIDVPNKQHQKCYLAVVATQNCLLLDEQVCIDFFDFTQDPTNIDATLPDTFESCVEACTPAAQQEPHFYAWYNLKYNICSQAI